MKKLLGLLGSASETASPTFWMDSAYNSRLPLSVTQSSGATLTDALVTATIPAAVTIDANSLRVVETTTLGGIDQPHGWRYGAARSKAINVNRMVYLPASLSGQTLTFKALGDWANGETRTFHAYWNAAGGIAAANFHHLGSVASTPYLLLGRTGPDTDASTQFVPYGYGPVLDKTSGNAQLAARWGIGAGSGVAEQIVLLKYTVQADGSAYGLSVYTPTTVNNGPTQLTSGTVVGETRLAARDWDATFSMTHENRVLEKPKADGTGSVLKSIDLYRVAMVFTCQRAYTPQTETTTLTNQPSQYVLNLASGDTSFVGNTTTPVGERIAFFYNFSGTTPLAMSTFREVCAQPIADLIVGSAGSTNCFAMRHISCTLSGFGASQPNAQVSPCSVGLYLYGLSNSGNIAQGATISLDFWYAHSRTPDASASGTNLLPSEMVAFLRSCDQRPTATVGTKETYAAAGLTATIKQASTDAVAGCQWFADNALAYTGTTKNTAFQKDLVTGLYSATDTLTGVSDEDDGSYGEAHKLHGLCLRYLRLHEASVLTQIEREVQYFIDMEADLVTQAEARSPGNGSWWSGAISYWRSPSNSNTPTTADGGAGDPGTPANIWPGMAGGALAFVTYSQGQIRLLTSLDQMHMTAQGLFAYLYLLRNESAVTANTTLITNTKSLISRMVTFEAAHWPNTNCIIANLYRIVQNLTPTYANGITATLLNQQSGATLPNPYDGTLWGPWQLSNTDQISYDPTANNTIDDFFRALFATGASVTGVTRYLKGRSEDMVAADLGHHDVTTTQTTFGSLGDYPKGWGSRGGSGSNDLKYTNGRSGDDHFFQLNAGGRRDHMTGRHAQRLVVLCLAALMDRTLTIGIETDGSGNLTRTANVVTLADQAAATLANFIVEPTSKATRFSAARWLGSSNPKLVDSAYTGYWLMACELYLLVKASASYATYYPIGTW